MSSAASPARKRACLRGLALACTFGASTAQASTFDAPPECGSADAFGARVAATRDPARPEGEASVAIERDGDHYTLLVRTPAGTRALHDRDCGPLLDAAVLIVALGDARQAAPPEAAQEANAPAPPAPRAEELAAPPRAPRPVRARPVVQEAAREARAPLALHGALSAGLDTGLVPGVSSTLGASLALTRGAWGVALGAHYTTPKVASNGALGLRVDALGPALDVLWQASPRLGLALGADLFVMRVQGRGELAGRTAWGAQTALHAAGSFAFFAKERWRLEAFVRGYVLPSPAAFVFAGERLYAGSRVAALLGLSLRANIF